MKSRLISKIVPLIIFFAYFYICFGGQVKAQKLVFPERDRILLPASSLIPQLRELSREQRESRILKEIVKGNIPSFLRRFWKIKDSLLINDKKYHYHYYCMPDYLAVGSDDDYLLIPMSARLAQSLADLTQAILPTAKMVDQIYLQAIYKLRPQPIPPSPEMTTIPVFAQHNKMIKLQRDSLGLKASPALAAGHKKDVIISNKIYQKLKPNVPNPVVIYGWHRLNRKAIQPVYNGHGEMYADYSHGIRLVYNKIWINGKKRRIDKVLKSKKWHVLLSNEGRIWEAKYGLK